MSALVARALTAMHWSILVPLDSSLTTKRALAHSLDLVTSELIVACGTSRSVASAPSSGDECLRHEFK